MSGVGSERGEGGGEGGSSEAAGEGPPIQEWVREGEGEGTDLGREG